VPLPVPDGEDAEAALEAALGPALARLRQTFASTEDYLAFWRAHPALAGHWSADVEGYVRYDLAGEPGSMRSLVSEAAVSADTRDITAGKPCADALGRLTQPTPLLTAPAGFMGEPPGLLPPELVATWAERTPQLRPQLVPGTNHYTIMFDKAAAATVAAAITRTAK
jgi:hypothetical protein